MISSSSSIPFVTACSSFPEYGCYLTSRISIPLFFGDLQHNLTKPIHFQDLRIEPDIVGAGIRGQALSSSVESANPVIKSTFRQDGSAARYTSISYLYSYASHILDVSEPGARQKNK